ncbi:MAG: hypothetical protein NC914_03710 [Candidatus Omnitrophica bacterium]|nr:hypothetical protein [Candidatus Omnitrophota bacterium]
MAPKGELDFNQARIHDYSGLVEISRDGQPLKVRKNTTLKEADEITVYYDSYLELYFDNKKANIIRVEGENSFILQDLTKAAPYAFEIKSLPEKKQTQIILIYSEGSWTKKYLEVLQKGKIPYTVVFVKEGVVATESLEVARPQEVLVRQGQMTYIFKGKVPFAAMPWEEYIDMCIEDCWSEW